MSGKPGPRGFTQATKDVWFYLALAGSGIALVELFWPYLFVLLFAGVTVVVTWPAYTRILKALKGRTAVASIVTSLALFLSVFVPLGILGYIFVLETVEVVQRAVKFVQDGGLDVWAADLRLQMAAFEDPTIAPLIGEYLPKEFDIVKALFEPLKSGALAALNTAGGLVPSAINGIVNGSIDALIFVFAIPTFYAEGPRFLTMIKNLSPMDDEYDAHLFHVFQEFATNMVVGSVATAAAQGAVAGISFAIAGVDGVFFFSICVAVLSFVPFVGAMVVWVPLTLAVGWEHGLGWAIFLAAWNILFTGTVDNVLKPFFLRGSSDIHPLLIFLAVFGGMSWMGLPGVLVGPVIVAFFLALYTIYLQDFLGQREAATEATFPAPEPGSVAAPTLGMADAPKEAPVALIQPVVVDVDVKIDVEGTPKASLGPGDGPNILG